LLRDAAVSTRRTAVTQ